MLLPTIIRSELLGVELSELTYVRAQSEPIAVTEAGEGLGGSVAALNPADLEDDGHDFALVRAHVIAAIGDSKLGIGLRIVVDDTGVFTLPSLIQTVICAVELLDLLQAVVGLDAAEQRRCRKLRLGFGLAGQLAVTGTIRLAMSKANTSLVLCMIDLHTADLLYFN